ncbi:MAG: hypothetical protein K2L19_02900 [Eubacterium sp.]|nr:hypothetical protein [Eubacterium sp.]
MNELLEIVADRPLIVVRAVIVIITVIGLTVKLIVPKIKERAGRIKDTSSNDGGTYLQKGFELYHSGKKNESVELIIKGLELGGRGVYDNDIIYACRILMKYYDDIGEEYNALRWCRFAVENNCFDKSILEYMIQQYEHMGEITKVEEIKELLKNS